jgi:DNA-binding Lrp family transcriptional regulator
VKKPDLDDLDRRLIDLLSTDARVSNRKIAAELGVTEGTIRGRIKRLQQDNLIRFTAITNASYVGTPRLVLIGIETDQDKVREVARKIADLPQINAVLITLGRFHILAIGLFDDLDQIWNVANNELLALPGVRRVETTITVRTLKYNYRTAKITQALELDDEEEDDED